jgi:hypothetical protein
MRQAMRQAVRMIVVAVRSLVLSAQRNDNPSVASDVPARAVAVAGAFFWGFLFFGLIDLLVPLQDPEFYDSYLLETGWGLLFAVLVAVPLIASAMRPRCSELASQVAVASAAVAVPAIFTPAPEQLLVAVGLLFTCLVQRAFIRRAPTPTQKTHRGPRPWRLRPRQLPSWTLVLVAAVAGVAYAADMIAAGRAGRYPVDHTWGLDHWPMQASLGLCIPAVAAIAVLRRPCGQVAAWTAAIAAMWLGVMSVLYPQHAGSLGQTAGTACATWGLLLAVDSVLTTRRRWRH